MPTFTPLPAPTATLTPEPAAAELEGSYPFNVSQTDDGGNRSTMPRAILDTQNNLHVFWIDTAARDTGDDVFHRMRSPEGLWTPTTIVTEPFALYLNNAVLPAVMPAARVCVFIDGRLDMRVNSSIFTRCYNGTVWDEPVVSAELRSERAVFALAFDANGLLQGVYNRGNDAYALRTDEQISDGENIATIRFAIASGETLYAVWLRQGSPFTIEQRISGDGGNTWMPGETGQDGGKWTQHT